MNKKILLIVLAIFLVSCNYTTYEYEVCPSILNEGECDRFQISRILPSVETIEICNPNYLNDGGRSECEQVPSNQLLLKEGTNKKYCNGYYLSSDFVDNYWNAEGVIDGCEITIGGNEQFTFKRHDQSIISHTGTIQVAIQTINYDLEFKAMQFFIGEDNNNDNLPDSWIYCGNVDEIGGSDIKVIHCSGTNLKFVKLVNAPWNQGSLFLDYIEVLKI